MKKLVKLLGLVLLLIVVGIVAAGWYADGLAKTAIETGGTEALGAETRLESASVGFFDGNFTLAGLAVANPEGFTAASEFLAIGEGTVEVSLGTLMDDVVRLPKLVITGTRLNLEHRANGSNYEVILANLKKLESGDPGGDDGAGRYVIDVIEIEDTEVTASVAALGELGKVALSIPRVTLTGVGSESDRGLSLREMASVLTKALFAAVTDDGSGILPQVLAQDLARGLGDLQSLQALGIRLLDDAGMELGGTLFKGDLLEGVRKSVGGTAEGALKGLFGGDEKK